MYLYWFFHWDVDGNCSGHDVNCQGLGGEPGYCDLGCTDMFALYYDSNYFDRQGRIRGISLFEMYL